MSALSDEIFKKTMEDYISFFLTERSYRQLKEIQESRANIKVVEVTQDMVTDKRYLKHKCFVDRFNSVYVTLPYDYLTCGERINFNNIRNIRYKLYSLSKINQLFGNTIDVFHNGAKIMKEYIQIALFDNYFVIQLPTRYGTFTKMSVLIRPYIYDISARTTSVKISKEKINDLNATDFIVYINAKQSDSYSILEEADSITIRSNVNPTNGLEVTYIRNLNRLEGTTKIKNQHLDLANTNTRFPLPVNNILTFSNGLFTSLDLTPRTSNIFKSNTSYTGPLTVFYVYNDKGDNGSYNDNFLWYAEYNENLMNIINSPNLLPEFINEFKLFNEDISLSDFLENKYTDLTKYNKTKALATIDYNQELINNVYECLINNMLDNKFERKYIWTRFYDLTSYTRYNNKAENTDPNRQTNFISKMYLFEVPNANEYQINIYIDGLRYFDFRFDDRIDGIDYIYLKASRITKNSIIEFEYIKTKYNGIRTVQLLGNATNTINITKATKTGIILDRPEERFIRVYKKATDGSYILLSTTAAYNEDTDTLKLVRTDGIFKEEDTFVVANTDCCKLFKYNTKYRGQTFQVDLVGLELSNAMKSNFRIFKNGRELPNNTYSVTKLDNNKYRVVLNIKYTIYELIEIEYDPIPFTTVYRKDKLESDGKIDMIKDPYNGAGCERTMDTNEYYVLNGRRIYGTNYKVWCTKGMVLDNLKSQKHFCTILADDPLIASLMYDFRVKYREAEKLYSKYVVTIMDDGLLTDEEDDCIEPNIERTGELYYDLYQEFLKHNIIDLTQPLPEYIAFKYNPLVDKNLNNTLMIDTTEDQLYWMPLDGSMQQEDNLVKILDLYYKLLDDVHSIQVVDPGDIPDDLYNKYKQLFDNNVLVLQVPDFHLETSHTTIK